jgi:hypothetical protein
MRPVIAASTLLLLAGTAVADSNLAGRAPEAPAVTASKERERPQLAIGVNFPAMWKYSVGVSAAAGFATHHAIRANVARYDNGGDIGVLIGDVFFDGDGSDSITSGRNFDFGLSYMGFANKLWDGLFIEAGVLVRSHDKKFAEDNVAPEVHTDTMLFGLRGHIGYSWLIAQRVFVQAAVGASVGYEVGSETTTPSSLDYLPGMMPAMPETQDVSRSTTSAEGFLRFGGAFDLN